MTVPIVRAFCLQVSSSSHDDACNSRHPSFSTVTAAVYLQHQQVFFVVLSLSFHPRHSPFHTESHTNDLGHSQTPTTLGIYSTNT
jgi:hypothetical protein